jgi:excinuclease ABC subunit C
MFYASNNMQYSILKQKVAKFPQNPGVYIFRDKSRKILYIGKATNLRSRVGSYFRGAETREHIESMMPNVFDVDFRQTDSVLEALISESNLIKKYQPKYNIKEKDDKSFSYFIITNEKFPRVIILRGTDLDKNKNIIKYTFGPFTSKKQIEIALKIIRKIFPFHSNNQKTEKGCLDYQIGLCSGPYDNAISREEYKKNIRGIKMILEGKMKKLIASLEKEMNKAAKKNEFEKAAELRNKIFALKHIRDVALITKDFEEKLRTTNYEPRTIRIEAYDISNISGTNAVGSMVVFANDEPDKSQYRKFKIKTIQGSDDVGMMREVLNRRFYNDWPMPDLVLLDGGVGHLNMAEKLLHKELGLNVAIASVAKGPKRKNQELRITNHELKPEIKNILSNKNIIKRIMDEAHRFAIAYHRKLRKGNFI